MKKEKNNKKKEKNHVPSVRAGIAGRQKHLYATHIDTT